MLILLAFYVGAIISMKHMKNTKRFNYIFSTVILLCYLFTVIRTYLSVGLHDWNFLNTLPVANVSPFMFTLVGLIYLIPLNGRKHLYLLISLLSVGMLFSPILGCVYNASIHYKFHLPFL